MIAAMTSRGRVSAPVAPELGDVEDPNPLLVFAVAAEDTDGQPRMMAALPPAEAA
jgi:hypothetical protein